MDSKQALVHGFGHLRRQWRVLLGLYLVNLLFALPLTIVMSDAIEASIGDSGFHETLREGFDYDWYAEFAIENDGLAEAFRPSVIGIGAIYDNLDAWWSGRLFSRDSALVWLGLGYATVWAFLLGGVLASAQGRDGLPGIGAFLAAGARTFARFVGLALISLVLYGSIFRLSTWLFELLEESLREATAETTAFRATLAIAAFVVLLLHLVRLFFDYAKVAVAKDDVGPLRGLARSGNFLRARCGRAVAVYVAVLVLGLALLGLYALVAPGAKQSSWASVLLAFAVSQLYLVGRLTLRVALLGSELALYVGANGLGRAAGTSASDEGIEPLLPRSDPSSISP